MSKPTKTTERIGIEFTTNEGYQVIVIDYITCEKVQVMFLDDYKYTTWTQWSHLKKGSLKNPFHKSVYGVGYLGVMENKDIPKATKNGQITKEYRLWSHMLERCYSEEYHKTRPTYKDCTVAEEWHNFSQFLNDLPKIKDYELWKDNDNYVLNKDIYYSDLGIITDEKEYSLLTTRFITDSENSKEMRQRRTN